MKEPVWYMYDATILLQNTEERIHWPVKLHETPGTGAEWKKILDEQDRKLAARLKFEDLLSSKLTKVSREDAADLSAIPLNLIAFSD